MNQQELIADLRNKLGPIKNYIALTEVLKRAEMTVNIVGDHAPMLYLYIEKKTKLKKQVEEEMEQVKLNMPEIEEILKQMEEL